MGGKNHQPCRGYLENSTKMSRNLSVAHAELELGNVALEDLLLSELCGKKGGINPFVDRLRSSAVALSAALGSVDALRQQMVSNDFVDLPTLQSADLSAIGSAFVERGMVHRSAWDAVAQIMREKGFFGILPHFGAGISRLHGQTLLLAEKASALHPAAAAGEVTNVLEENRTGNIKVEFANLYSSWSDFNQLFLASSMLSTELWYLHTKRDSLCADADSKVAAVA